MKDRKPRYPGRVKLTPVPGLNNTYDMERADNPEIIGDPLNKKTLLQDETAEALGIPARTNPQVDDAFKRIAYLYDNRYRIGDTRTTIRTDLSENWALCNGDTVYLEGGDISPQLYEMLDTGLRSKQLRLFTKPSSLNTQAFTHVKDGMWSVANFNGQGGAAVYDPLWGTYIEIGNNSLGVNNSPYGSIIGIVWDGKRYVMASITNSNSISFYTSDDLVAWTLAKTWTNSSYPPGYSNGYGTMRFVWDGAAYRVAAWYNGYQAHYLYTFDAEFNFKGHTNMNNGDIYATDGLFSIGYGYDAYLYEPGSTSVLASPAAISSDGDHSFYVKYAENQYVLIPVNYWADYIRFYNKVTNTKKSLSASALGAYGLGRVHLDKKNNELVIALLFSTSTLGQYDTGYARASLLSDLTKKESYTVIKSAAPDNKIFNDFIDDGESWIYIRGNGGNVDIAGPHPRKLPTISIDEAYTYIKVKEGE